MNPALHLAFLELKEATMPKVPTPSPWPPAPTRYRDSEGRFAAKPTDKVFDRTADRSRYDAIELPPTVKEPPPLEYVITPRRPLWPRLKAWWSRRRKDPLDDWYDSLLPRPPRDVFSYRNI